MSVYALLVGVNAYRDPIKPLRGCRADVDAAADYLRHRVAPGELGLLCLLDEQATYQAVIDAFQGHLGRAGRGDTALFWFSGHGSQDSVPHEWEHTEPSGTMQTMVCYDSRHGGVEDLTDKELARLIGEVAARGAHVAVILDCCHSESGSREDDADGGLTAVPEPLTVRWTPPPTEPPPSEKLPAGLAGGAVGTGPSRARTGGEAEGGRAASPARPSTADHVALAACRTLQSAYEIGLAGGYRGLFSLAVLNQLKRLGPDATYRSLMTAVRCDVENKAPRQEPVLYPMTGTIADQPVLGGAVRSAASGMTMRCLRGVWEIDAGAIHGVASGEGTDAARVGVHGSGSGRAPGRGPAGSGAPDPQEAVVVEVLPDRSLVDPVGGWADPARQYQVVFTQVPLSTTTVEVGGGQCADPATARRVEEAIRQAGLNGGPSPYVRVVDRAKPDETAEIRVEIPAPGVVRLRNADGSALTPAAFDAHDGPGAADVVADLKHIARWRGIKALANPRSRLTGKVRLEIVSSRDDLRDDRGLRGPAFTTDETGAVALAYNNAQQRHGLDAPEVLLRLHNTADRQLYCVLLDLTDTFRCDAKLFPGAFVAPHRFAWAHDGARIAFSLPSSRAHTPGAQVTDWLMLLVAEEPFASDPFELGRLGEGGVAERDKWAFSGVLDRLGLLASYREATIVSPPVLDWTTSLLPVVTRVPGA